MQLTYDILLVLHILSWATVIGGWITNIRQPRVPAGVSHAAGLALVTGIAMVGIASASDDVSDPNNAKIAVKLVIAVIVAALAWQGEHKKDAVQPAMVHAMGGLAVVNVCIAILWT